MNILQLKDIFDFKNGRAFKKSEWKSTGVPIIRIQNLNSPNATFNYFNDEYDSAIEVNKGDLLFSWSGTVGTSFGPHVWSREKGVLNQHIFRLTKKIDIDTTYAYYALKEITAEIEKQTHGAGGLVHITKSKLENFSIPIPSIDEQRQIAERLSRAFATIDRTAELNNKSIEYTQQLIKQELKAVLEETTTGKMEVFGDYIKVATPKTKIQAKKFLASGDYPIVSQEASYISGYWNNKGDVMHFDKPVVVFGDHTRSIKYIDFDFVAGADGTKILLPPDDVQSRYLYYWLRANPIHGMGYARHFRSLKEMRIFVPSLEVQQGMTKHLDQFYATINSVTALRIDKKNKLDELRRSILTQAFLEVAVK